MEITFFLFLLLVLLLFFRFLLCFAKAVYWTVSKLMSKMQLKVLIIIFILVMVISVAMAETFKHLALLGSACALLHTGIKLC